MFDNMQMRQNVNNDVSKDSLIVSLSDSFYLVAISLYYYIFILLCFPHNL